MARVSINEETTQGYYQVKSTDTKPTQAVADGATLKEIDTGRMYEYSNANVNPVTGNGWWETLAEIAGYGVFSGLGVVQQSTPDMTVNIPDGRVYLADGSRFVVKGNAALAIDAADGTYNRQDLIYVDSDHLLQYLVGHITVAGERDITITVNPVEDDVLGLGGESFLAVKITPGTDEFNIGGTIALSATALAAALAANTAIDALYDVTNPTDGVITLTEKVPGAGDTPGASSKTGDIVISDGSATASAAAIKGARAITVTVNAVPTDTLTIDAQVFTAVAADPGAGEYVPGVGVEETAIALRALIEANATLGALYDVTNPSAGVILLTEKTAGGGNTPGAATPSGTIDVSNGSPTTSTAAVAGARSYTITHQASHKDTIGLEGESIRALKAAAGTDEFEPGADEAATALVLIDLINANATLAALFTASTGGDGIINLIEDTPGGGDTPGEMDVTGTGEVTNGDATESVTDGDALPATPAGGIAIAKLNVDASTAAIETAMITKLRTWTATGVTDA
jgi:hypothetical protein